MQLLLDPEDCNFVLLLYHCLLCLLQQRLSLIVPHLPESLRVQTVLIA